MYKTKAFTLVELIVVITILAILGTIAFISLQGYSSNARDSVRISDMKNIETGFEIDLTKRGKVLIPENKIDITASGTLIAYQGYAGKDTLNKIGINGGGKDPLDDSYYTYITSSTLTSYQILGYLESNTSLAFIGSSYALEYSKRFPKLIGSQLGVLVASGTLSPVQDLGVNIDIVNTNKEYKVFIKSNTLGNIKELAKMGTKVEKFNSCKEILKKYGAGVTSGTYYINPTGSQLIEVYCDMTNNDGGWTQISKKLLGSEISQNIKRTLSDINGIEISITTTLDGCTSEKKEYFISIGDTIDWEQIKFKQEFYGGTSCWGVFGSSVFNSELSLNQNLTPLDISNISNQIKMNTSTGNIFDGITARCDNETNTNFWHLNKGIGLRSANVILNKKIVNQKAGLYNDVNCNRLDTNWIYKDIFVK